MPSTTALTLLAFASITLALPNAAPAVTTSTPQPIKCDTKEIFGNDVCLDNHVCLPNPDIVCTAVFPSTCLKRYCLPFVYDDKKKPKRCGVIRGQPERLNCEKEGEDDGQICVDSDKIADIRGYCIWKDGRNAQTFPKPKGGSCTGGNLPREVGEGLEKRIVCLPTPLEGN